MNLQTYRNNSYNKSPSFKADIYSVNTKYFEQIQAKYPKIPEAGSTLFQGSREWLIENAVIGKPQAITHRASDCSLVSIINPQTKQLNMYHLSPYERTMSRLEKIGDTIFEQAKKLQGNFDVELEGLMLGSDSKALYGEDADSFRLQEFMKKTLEAISQKIGMATTIITGKKDSATNVSLISDAVKNTHYVLARPVRPSLGEFFNDFETKIFSPKDTFLINVDEIRDDDLF